MPRTSRALTESPCPALDRCRAAMQRAHAKVMATGTGTNHEIQCKAGRKAQEAYRAAMPRLTSTESARDYVTCLTYGLVIDIFYYWEAPALLAAARAVMYSFRSEPRPRKTSPARESPKNMEHDAPPAVEKIN